MYANLLQLRPVTYFWKATYQAGRTFNTDKQFGLIAQEVEQLFPDFVQTDKDGYKSVNYMALIPVMIQAIKAQQNQIENLKEANKTSGIELTQIQSQQASLENRLEAIEKILTAQQSK
jgi:translation initiation factor 2B subunit (eIF-2B alpha/beta/delta family)